MSGHVEAAFLDEVAEYGLRYRCAACVHVVAADRSCSLGYPNAALTGPWRVRDERGEVVFCKFFELGEDELPDPL